MKSLFLGAASYNGRLGDVLSQIPVAKPRWMGAGFATGHCWSVRRRRRDLRGTQDFAHEPLQFINRSL